MYLAKYKTQLLAGLGVLLIFVGSNVGSYFYGKVVARAEYEKDKVEVVERDRDRAVEDGQQNAETAERVGAETARLEAALEKAIRRAEDAIKANENRKSTTCELTDDELASLQAIRDSYEQ